MNKKQKQLYALAVYLLLAALAVIFALIGIHYYQEDHPMRGLLINLSTELAGVVLIFFVVNQLFLLDRDRDVFKEIEFLRNDIRARFSPLAWEAAGRDRFKLETYLYEAQSTDFLGYTLANLLGAFREPLAKSIRKGTHVRILLVDSASAAGELMRDFMGDTEVLVRDTKRSFKYISHIKELLEEIGDVKGSLTVRMTSWIPSCNMIIVEGEKETGVAKIGINTPTLRLPIGREYRDRLFLILSREEYPREFTYFKNQFDLLWNDKNTIPCDHTLPPPS